MVKRNQLMIATAAICVLLSLGLALTVLGNCSKEFRVEKSSKQCFGLWKMCSYQVEGNITTNKCNSYTTISKIWTAARMWFIFYYVAAILTTCLLLAGVILTRNLLFDVNVTILTVLHAFMLLVANILQAS